MNIYNRFFNNEALKNDLPPKPPHPDWFVLPQPYR